MRRHCVNTNPVLLGTEHPRLMHLYMLASAVVYLCRSGNVEEQIVN